MQCAARIPLDEIFLIPVLLEPCVVPARITRQIQYVSLFPCWEAGFEKILKTMAQPEEQGKRNQLPLAG